jgi:hypothetical protein
MAPSFILPPREVLDASAAQLLEQATPKQPRAHRRLIAAQRSFSSLSRSWPPVRRAAGQMPWQRPARKCGSERSSPRCVSSIKPNQ